MKAPLAERLRPNQLSEVVGQDHLVGENGFITKIVQSGKALSILLWGPAGCGKTSIARLYAKAFSMRYHSMSAIFNGVADLKKLIQELEATPLMGAKTLLFVDEIHRFNKAQQDAFLPYIENGTIILVGATTENPSFHLNSALLSRLRVLAVNPLSDDALGMIIDRYESKNRGLSFDQATRQYLIHLCAGDGRYLLNLIENLETISETKLLDLASIQNYLQKRSANFDKSGDQHYNLISALHKSVRGSDPDAALYWLARLLEGGEDPLFIARRLIRMASEDIGLADPNALAITIAARNAFEVLGSPEGELALAEATVYLALAPKSNAVYEAFKKARHQAAQTSHLPPPGKILNAPTKVMKEMGYGEGYVYDHDTPHGFSGQNYFPDQLQRESYYFPVERGFERDMKKRVLYFNDLRNKLSQS